MKIKDLEDIIHKLPEEAILLVEQEDVLDVATIKVEFHSDGRCHIIFSTLE